MEQLTFNHTITLGFSELTDGLQDRIYTRLTESDFSYTDFEVREITDYDVKEMKIIGNNRVQCSLSVTVSAFNPTVGKELTIDKDYVIKGDKLLYTSGRVHVIAKVITEGPSYRVRIESTKTNNKNILCVGTCL